MVGKRLHETLDDDETRKLLYETTVTWSEVKNTKDPKEARLFLFNNLLLLVRARKGVMATLFESNKNKVCLPQ